MLILNLLVFLRYAVLCYPVQLVLWFCIEYAVKNSSENTCLLLASKTRILIEVRLLGSDYFQFVVFNVQLSLSLSLSLSPVSYTHLTLPTMAVV